MNYHIIWCSKRRRKVLVDRVKTRLEELIRETVSLLECEILALEILPDHLHLVVSATPHWATQPDHCAAEGQIQPHLARRIPDLAADAVALDEKLLH